MDQQVEESIGGSRGVYSIDVICLCPISLPILSSMIWESRDFNTRSANRLGTTQFLKLGIGSAFPSGSSPLLFELCRLLTGAAENDECPSPAIYGDVISPFMIQGPIWPINMKNGREQMRSSTVQLSGWHFVL